MEACRSVGTKSKSAVSSTETHVVVAVTGIVLSSCRLPARSSEDDGCSVGMKSMFSSEGMHGVVAAARTMLPPCRPRTAAGRSEPTAAEDEGEGEEVLTVRCVLQ